MLFVNICCVAVKKTHPLLPFYHVLVANHWFQMMLKNTCSGKYHLKHYLDFFNDKSCILKVPSITCAWVFNSTIPLFCIKLQEYKFARFKCRRGCCMRLYVDINSLNLIRDLSDTCWNFISTIWHRKISTSYSFHKHMNEHVQCIKYNKTLMWFTCIISMIRFVLENLFHTIALSVIFISRHVLQIFLSNVNCLGNW